MMNFKLNAKKMNIEQYRGKNYVLKVDTQEQWDSVIPMFRKNCLNKLESNYFNKYKNTVIYICYLNEETYGPLENVNLKKYTIINFPNQIIELW
jgi:hypothetical protein